MEKVDYEELKAPVKEESGSNKYRYPRGFGLGAIFWKSTGFLGRFQVSEIEINQFHNIY